MKEFVLGIDMGSGSVKLTLLGKNSMISGTSGCEYPTSYPHPGWCEQNPEDWCNVFRKALAALHAQTGVLPEQIKALASDAATHPAVLWTDQRSREQAEQLRQNHLGVIPKQSLNTPTTVWTLPQLMWLREQQAAPTATGGIGIR